MGGGGLPSTAHPPYRIASCLDRHKPSERMDDYLRVSTLIVGNFADDFFGLPTLSRYDFSAIGLNNSSLRPCNPMRSMSARLRRPLWFSIIQRITSVPTPREPCCLSFPAKNKSMRLACYASNDRMQRLIALFFCGDILFESVQMGAVQSVDYLFQAFHSPRF